MESLLTAKVFLKICQFPLSGMAFHACVVLCDPIASGGKMYDLGDMSVSTVLLTCHGYG